MSSIPENLLFDPPKEHSLRVTPMSTACPMLFQPIFQQLQQSQHKVLLTVDRVMICE